MESTLTIRLDKDLVRLLEKATKKTKLNRSEMIRESLRRQLSIFAFEQLRSKAMPFAQRAGFLTDEDVFDAIS